jgi:ABC-2 type transport system ATP-binding protein
MIACTDLGRRFGPREAVAGLSFTVEPGEVLGLLGPNGAGKTTTMRMLTTALRPTSGTARVAGFDVRDHPNEVRARVGYLPEGVPLPGEARVEELLAFAAAARRLAAGAARAQGGELLVDVGLAGYERRLVGTLSKGQRQRVGLALAMLGQPPVLILDEPTVGLDPEQVIGVRQLVRQLGRTATVLFSSHILSEVEAVCERVLIIRDGRCVALEPIAGLADRLGAHPWLVLRVGAVEEAWLRAELERFGAAEVRAEDGDWVAVLRADPAAAPLLARAIVEAGGALRELRVEHPTLEDLFLSLVQPGGAS